MNAHADSGFFNSPTAPVFQKALNRELLHSPEKRALSHISPKRDARTAARLDHWGKAVRISVTTPAGLLEDIARLHCGVANCPGLLEPEYRRTLRCGTARRETRDYGTRKTVKKG